jgi:hypothetical protein
MKTGLLVSMTSHNPFGWEEVGLWHKIQDLCCLRRLDSKHKQFSWEPPLFYHAKDSFLQ